MIYPMVEVLKLLAEADAKLLKLCKSIVNDGDTGEGCLLPTDGGTVLIAFEENGATNSESCLDFRYDTSNLLVWFTADMVVTKVSYLSDGLLVQETSTASPLRKQLVELNNKIREVDLRTTHKQIIEFLLKLGNSDEDISAVIRDIWYDMLRNIKLPNGVLDITKEEEGTVVVRFKHDYAVEFGIASGTNDTLVLPYDLEVTHNGISMFNFAGSFVNAAAEIQGFELDLAAELEGKEPAKKTVKIKTQRFKTAVDLRKTYQANEAKRKAAEQRQVLVDAEVLRITESLHGDAVLGVKKPMKLTQKPSIRTYVIEQLRELKYTVTNNVVTWWETDDHHVN